MPDYDVVLPVSWWARDLGRARGLFEVFGQRPASLTDALCVEARFDPFPGLVWLSVNLADAPNPPPARWRRRGHDALQLRLQFTGCRSVRVRGRLEAGGCPVDVHSSDEGIRIRLKSDRLDADFLADSGLISRMVPFRRSEDFDSLD